MTIGGRSNGALPANEWNQTCEKQESGNRGAKHGTMRYGWLALLGVAVFILLFSQEPVYDYDLLIRNGRVIDGSGSPARSADLAIKDGKIVRLGTVEGSAKTVIDAQGKVVAPGFIDVHTHAESVRTQIRAENFVRMGVTSIVTGNCGGSVLNVGEFFKQLEEKPASVNVATLIGHNTVRSEAMGGSFNREPTAEELDRMKSLVEQAMKEGAVGLSTGLIYLPGTFSKTEEIIDLAKVAAQYNGIYASHMRSESLAIRDALNELFRIAREAKIRAQVSHIKLSGNASWGQAKQILQLIEKARAEGLEIKQDQYVYTASSTGISTIIPSDAREGGRDKFLQLIQDPAEKAKLVERIKENLKRNDRHDFSYAVIASYGKDSSLNGKSIPQAAKVKRGSDTLDDQIELIFEIEASGGASGVFHGINEQDLQVFLKHPNTMFASDSGVRAFNSGVPHPRGYGNNARVLARYVRELKLLRLEEAVRRMSSLPAETFRLRERGLLKEGYWADIVIFDPDTIQDTATFEQPHQYPTGMDYVLVNGVIVIEKNAHTGATPGKPLRFEKRD